MRRIPTAALSALIATTVSLGIGEVNAQQKSMKEQLAGAWTLVSVDQTSADGTKHQLFGANPKGLMILDPSGKYVLIITQSGREKFKANSRIQGTPEENTAAVKATTASFGTWSVDGNTMTVRIEAGLYPNQDGTSSTRTVSVSGDELKVNNPMTASGMKSENVYKRAK
jgi:hypothetical protein